MCEPSGTRQASRFGPRDVCAGTFVLMVIARTAV